jgi:hypothetical protein
VFWEQPSHFAAPEGLPTVSKKDKKDLKEFLKPFDDHIVKLALSLREFVWDLYPECNELIYDNYNAVAIGWAPTLTLNDIFCSIAIYSNAKMHFGFYWGSKLADPKKMLLEAANSIDTFGSLTERSFQKLT